MEGKVYWITGLSGAGKTTIGTLLYEKIRSKKDNVVLLDGDTLREILKQEGYTNEERNRLAFQYSSLCYMLAKQGIDVVICTIAMYDNVRAWNKVNIKNYKEIYLKVPIKTLINRDQKGLYSRALRKEIFNVLGMDIDFEEPKQPDLIICNDGKSTPNEVMKKIINKINI